MPRKTGEYNLRIVVQRRVLGAKGANGEDTETWPDPDVGESEYFAAREAMSAGETIVQGIRNSTGTMKLRIKGRAIPVDSLDRIKVKHTGEVYNVTATVRDWDSTVITVERYRSQTVGQ